MIKFSEEFELYSKRHDNWLNDFGQCWVRIEGKRVTVFPSLEKILQEARHNGEKSVFAEKVEAHRQLLLMPLERRV